jgi:hypothetical protein
MVKLFVSWVLQREGEYPEFGSTIIDDVRAPKYGHDLFRLKLELAETQGFNAPLLQLRRVILYPACRCQRLN